MDDIHAAPHVIIITCFGGVGKGWTEFDPVISMAPNFPRYNSSGIQDENLSIDSVSVKIHQSANDEKSGLNTKIHTLVTMRWVTPALSSDRRLES